MLNKKADVKAVAEIILVLIGLLLLYAIITSGYVPFLEKSGTSQACKNWVNLQSTSLLEEAHLFKSPCVTTEDTIKSAKTEDDIYKKLADNMYECWDTYGRGESDFYSNFDFGSADKYCRICSEIKISSDLPQDKRNVDIDKFEEYLTNNYPPGHKETYAEFFIKAENANIDFGSGKLNLDPEKKLYTAFVVYKKSTPEDFWKLDSLPTIKELGFGTGGCVAGAATGFIAGGLASLPSGGVLAPILAPLGAVGGCAFGFIGGDLLSVTGYSDYLYPSMTLFESTSDQIQNVCDYVYYKPISSQDNFKGGGGEFGGGGASGKY